MDPLTVLPPWVPEDDLLLKNAVEAGASLESLAKGAVQFSRRYSVTELRDRWRSLLYDHDVSSEASASMAKLELARYNCNGNGTSGGDGGGCTSKKKKAQSIRKQYYAMRKRLCTQVFDMALHDEMSVENNAVVCDGKEIDGSLNKDKDTNVSMNMNHLLVNSLVECENYSGGLGEAGVGPSHSMSEVPLWKTIEDVSVPAMPVQVSLENENGSSEVGQMSPHGLKGKCGNGVLNDPDSVLGDVETNISDALLDLTNEDELLFVDIDGKDETTTNVDSILLSSPGDIQGNDASDVRESQKLDAETKLAVSSGSSTESEIVANPLGSSHGDLGGAQSSAAAESSCPEPREELMICVLNTEDPDIPCNDSGNESSVVPRSVTPKPHSIVKEVGYPGSSINSQRRNESDGSLRREDIPSHSLAVSQTVRQGLVHSINSSNSPVGVVLKTENPARNSISAVSRQSNNVVVNVNPSHSRLVHGTTTIHASDGHLKQEEVDAAAPADVYAHPTAEEYKDLPDSEAKLLSLDQEGGDDDDDEDDDDDNEIPYFSDAETMILEMDLSPTEQDASASREVSRFQHEETKRTIMRLEQCAQSFLRRAIASRGALAVLYGRDMKEYIKKSEVILGRATDEIQVDIDLSREGCANKISRRQALIKLDANGSFIIKNLGKGSIFLNGKEVATGQLRGLSASSLIEIRGLSFIFEFSNECVRRFLENVNENRER